MDHPNACFNQGTRRDIPHFLNKVDQVLADMEETFSKEEFLYKFPFCRSDFYGYQSLDRLLFFRGCRHNGVEFSYSERTALQEKARIAASHLNKFTLPEFKEKYRSLFFTGYYHLKERGFASVDDLLRSIRGMTVVRSSSDQVEYFLPQEFHPVFVAVDPVAAAAEKQKKHSLFKKKATVVAKFLGRFTNGDFNQKWREIMDVDRDLNPAAFGFDSFSDLYRTIPGVRAVLRSGETYKYYYKESAVEDDNEEEDEEKHDDGRNMCFEDNKQYPVALKVARTLANPFTEAQLVEAVSRHYNITIKEIFHVGDRKLPLFLETISGIKYIGDGKYEYDGYCHKRKKKNDCDEDKWSVMGEGEDHGEFSDCEDDKKMQIYGKAVKKESRHRGEAGRENGEDSVGNTNKRELASSSVFDKEKALPVSFSFRMEGQCLPRVTVKRHASGKVSECIKIESDDSDEDEDSTVKQVKRNTSLRKNLSKHQKVNGCGTAKQHLSAEKSEEYIQIGSSDDDEPAKKRKNDTSSKRNNQENGIPSTKNKSKLQKEPFTHEQRVASGTQNVSRNKGEPTGKKEKVTADAVRSRKTLPEQRKGGSIRWAESDDSDEEEEILKDNTPVNNVNKGHECNKGSQKRPSAERSIDCVEIGSSDEEEPTVKKAKKKNSSGRLPSQPHSDVNGSGKERNKQSEDGRDCDNATVRKKKKNRHAEGISPPASHSMSQGPIPHEQLQDIASHVQKILAQQGIGGAAAQKPIPLIDLEAEETKEENSRRMNPFPSGSGQQATNNLPSIVNPGIQSLWGQQVPFGAPQYSMFHAGFPGRYGAPVLPGFGNPPPMYPMVPPPSCLLPNNIMDFLAHHMGPALATALQQGATPLELAKKVFDKVYGNQQMPPSQQ